MPEIDDRVRRDRGLLRSAGVIRSAPASPADLVVGFGGSGQSPASGASLRRFAGQHSIGRRSKSLLSHSGQVVNVQAVSDDEIRARIREGAWPSTASDRLTGTKPDVPLRSVKSGVPFARTSGTGLLALSQVLSPPSGFPKSARAGGERILLACAKRPASSGHRSRRNAATFPGRKCPGGESTVTLCCSAGFSANVRETIPGPVVIGTTNWVRNQSGIPRIISAPHFGSRWPRTQLSMSARMKGCPGAAPKP